jgi:hypothetical protein
VEFHRALHARAGAEKFFESQFRQIRPCENDLGIHGDPCACTGMYFSLGPGWIGLKRPVRSPAGRWVFDGRASRFRSQITNDRTVFVGG